jgi:hypothetical protein
MKKNLLHNVLLKLSLGLVCFPLISVANPLHEYSDAFTVTHVNDISITGKTSGAKTGDDLLTGVLKVSYKKDDSFYEMVLNTYTQRHILEGKRIDTLSFAYLSEVLKKEDDVFASTLMLGPIVTASGNFAGESLQDAVHALSNNPHYNLEYDTASKVILGLDARYLTSYKYSTNVSFYNHLNAQAHSDGSVNANDQMGVLGVYDGYAFWAGIGVQYIEPFDNAIIKSSTVDTFVTYALLGASMKISEKYELMIETSIGGAMLGEKDDYATKFSFKYFLEN